MKRTLIGLLFLTSSFKVNSQQCPNEYPLLFCSYKWDDEKLLNFEMEFGFQKDDSPLGYFGGFQVRETRSPKSQESNNDMQVLDLLIYFKGSIRLLRKDDLISIFLIAGPAISMVTGFSIHSGFRLIVPLSERFGIVAEPLYAMKEKKISIGTGICLLLSK